MPVDVFISYAWTSDQHREWVNLLTIQLKSLGYNVLVDANVDYGHNLSNFMEQIKNSNKVLIIADENYVHRANSMPSSGVGIENMWLQEVYSEKPQGWLTVIYKDNHNFLIPNWLKEHNPKGFDFNSNPSSNSFPEKTAIEDLWRWIEGLGVKKNSSIGFQELRNRSKILETITSQRDRSNWSSPHPSGQIKFQYEKSANKSYYLGAGEYQFILMVSSYSINSVYVYSDPIVAVGINVNRSSEIDEIQKNISSGRYVVAQTGEQVILLNRFGSICLVDIISLNQGERQASSAEITFKYQILTYS